MLLLLNQANATETLITYKIPDFADPNESIEWISSIFYGIWLCILFLFLISRKSLFGGLKKQAVIMQGILFGSNICMVSVLKGMLIGVVNIISLIAAPICAILSVNDKFKNIFICLINGFYVSYFTCFLFRINNILEAALILVVAYFIFLLLIAGSEKLQTCFAEIFTGTLAVISFIDLFKIPRFFATLHGASGRTKIIDIFVFFICAIILLLNGAYFVGINYFSKWVDEKENKIKEIAAKKKEQVAGE